MRRAVFSILVGNSSGVLSRVAGMFSRRGYNIDSLTVGETLNPELSRMTIAVTGEDDVLEQIEKQLRKMVDVLDVKKLNEGVSVCRELIMVKIRASAEERQAIVAVTDIFRAKVVDVGPESMIIELTGNQSKLEAFIQLLSNYEILELARTGVTGLSRGSDDVKYF